MGLKFARDDNSLFEIAKVRYSTPNKRFTAKDLANTDTLDFYYPLGKSDAYDIPISRFDIHLFSKNSFSTNDIFKVRVKGEILGWLFPIQALLNDEHDYATNSHFLPYGFVAYKKLLLESVLPNVQLNSSEPITLEKLFGENTFVLVLYKTAVSDLRKNKNIDFKLDHYIVYLYSCGFTRITATNFNTIISSQSREISYNALNQDDYLTLKPISDIIVSDLIYINDIIEEILIFEKKELVRFHLLYSLVELFIAKIFESTFKKVVADFTNSADFYESKERLAKITNEKDRIKQLFNNCSSGIDQSHFQSLKTECNNFLNNVFGSTFNLPCAEALYKVRSTIFHNLRILPKGYEANLSQVTLSLEIVVLEILMYFKLS
jgi:hypothetical protein